MTIKSQESDFILAPASLNLITDDAAWPCRNQRNHPLPTFPLGGKERVGEIFTKFKELERYSSRDSINNDFIVFFGRVL
jgi:hypothetical protein